MESFIASLPPYDPNNGEEDLTDAYRRRFGTSAGSIGGGGGSGGSGSGGGPAPTPGPPGGGSGGGGGGGTGSGPGGGASGGSGGGGPGDKGPGDEGGGEEGGGGDCGSGDDKEDDCEEETAAAGAAGNGNTGEETCGSSIIDNVSFTHRHFAVDYRNRLPVGCASCGGGARPWSLPRLELRRVHRYKEVDWQGSFGAGVFSNYDVRCRLYQGQGADPDVIEIFDPMMRQPVDVTHQTGGAYADQRWQVFASVQLYSDESLNTTTADQSLARFVVFTGYSGRRTVLEIIHVDDQEADCREARLHAIYDRNGNALRCHYEFAADATQSALGHDRDQLRKLDRIVDAYGNQAVFAYARHAGQWVVDRITCPNASVVQYTYDATGMVSLAGVAYPDGSQSSFDANRDKYGQQLRVHIHDAGSGGTHRNKTISLTLPEYQGSGGTQAQPSNCIRRVWNGEGEQVYANWLETDPNDATLVNIYVAQGNQTLMRYTVRNGAPVKLEKAISWTPGSTDTSSFTWEDVASHATAARDLISETVKPQGLKLVYERNHASGIPTKVSLVDASTGDSLGESIFEYNDYRQPTLRVDRRGRATRYSYESARPWLRTGMTTGLSYDPNSGQTSTTADTAVWYWTYNTRGQVSSSTNPNNQTTNYDYDGKGYLVSVTAAPDHAGDDRAVTRYSYDSIGQIQAVVDPIGRAVRYFYDARGRIDQSLYHDGSSETAQYTTSGINTNLVSEVKDRNGNLTRFSYDKHGRVTRKVSLPPDAGVEDNIQTFTYVAGTGRIAQQINNGEEIINLYDDRLRVISQLRKPLPGQTLASQTVYDALGRVQMRIDPYGRRTFPVYDLENREIRTVRETLPGAIADGTDLVNLTRDLSPNPSYLIVDQRFAPGTSDLIQVIDPRGIVSTTAYDWQGRMAERVASAAKLVAGSNTEVTPITDARVARRTVFSYDGVGNITAVQHPRYFDSTDTEGYQRSEDRYTYTGRNLRASHTVAHGTDIEATESWTYTLDKRLATYTDFNNKAWQSIWHLCCGRLQARVDPLGNGRISNNDYAGNVVHEAVASGLPLNGESYSWHDPVAAATKREVTRRFDHRHRITHQTVWLQSQGNIDPNALIPIAGEDGVPASAGLTTRYYYDDHVDDGLDFTPPYTVDLSTYNFDSTVTGAAYAEVNPAGEWSVVILDGLGRRLRVYDAEGSFMEVTHDELSLSNEVDQNGAPIPAGLLKLTATDPVGSETTSYTDGGGRTRYQRDALGKVSSRQFNANGSVLHSRDANDNGHDCVYDDAERLSSCTDAVGSSSSFTYDANSNRVSATDAMSRVTTTNYDARGRRVQVDDRLPGPSLTTFTYDANNNLLTIKDADAHTNATDAVTTYLYDDRNLLVEEWYPGHDDNRAPGHADYDKRVYTYDAAQQQLTRNDQTGTLRTHVYDLAGRITERRYPDNKDDVFTYDAASRLLTASSERYDNVVSRTWYPDGTLQREELQIGGQTYGSDYVYDDANRLTTMTYPGGVDLVRRYTDRHQVERIDWRDQALMYFTYDDVGRELTRKNRGIYIVTTRTWRDDNLLDNIVSTYAGRSISEFDYSYNANKWKTSETNAVVTAYNQDFQTYDELGRLTNWQRPNQAGAAQTWNLSAVGDWLDTTKNGVLIDHGHNDVHEISSYTIAGAAQSVSHDAKGNITTNPAKAQIYTWDVENRLVTSTDQSSTFTASYRYDALGRRVAKTVAGSETVFVCAGDRLIAEYAAGSAPASAQRYYVYGSYIDDVLAEDVPGDAVPLRFLYGNHLYSVDIVASPQGQVLERYAYGPYGERVVLDADGNLRTGTTPMTSIGFTGRYADTETGLWYFRARYFDSELGRFLGRDPLGYTDGMSLYGGYFVPNAVDPTGELAFLLPFAPAIAKGVAWVGTVIGVGYLIDRVTDSTDVGRTGPCPRVEHCKKFLGSAKAREQFAMQVAFEAARNAYGQVDPDNPQSYDAAIAAQEGLMTALESALTHLFWARNYCEDPSDLAFISAQQEVLRIKHREAKKRKEELVQASEASASGSGKGKMPVDDMVSMSVKDANKSIKEQLGRRKNAQVTVETRADAETILRSYTSGPGHKGGYLNATESPFSPDPKASDWLPRESNRKQGMYHWDPYDANAPAGDHAIIGPHLQIHTFEGQVIRVLYKK